MEECRFCAGTGLFKVGYPSNRRLPEDTEVVEAMVRGAEEVEMKQYAAIPWMLRIRKRDRVYCSWAYRCFPRPTACRGRPPACASPPSASGVAGPVGDIGSQRLRGYEQDEGRGGVSMFPLPHPYPSSSCRDDKMYKPRRRESCARVKYFSSGGWKGGGCRTIDELACLGYTSSGVPGMILGKRGRRDGGCCLTGAAKHVGGNSPVFRLNQERQRSTSCLSSSCHCHSPCRY